MSLAEKPDCLNWTPSQLYSKINSIAQKRYSYTLLPVHIYDLKGNETQKNKVSMLRDICIFCGLQVNLNLNQRPIKWDYKGDEYTYSNLPFAPEHILDFTPILKHPGIINKESQIYMAQGRSLMAEMQYEQAIDVFNQAMNSILSVYGPIHLDMATCLSKQANIQYKSHDYIQAIELQTKAILIQEKILGFDHSRIAYDYSNLGLYYFQC